MKRLGFGTAATLVAFLLACILVRGGGERAKEGGRVRTLEGHQNWVRAVAFSPDGKALVSGGLDANVRLRDPRSGKLKHTMKGH